MRKVTRYRIILLITIGLVVYLILLNQIDRLGVIGGNWTILTNQLIGYLPQLIGISLGFIFIIKDFGNYESSTARMLLMTGFEGVFFASLFYELNNDGIWIDEIITATFTIADLQIIVIIFFILLGVLIGLIRR